MAIVNVYVNKRIASVDAGLELVCNNPTDTINFVFDEEWAAYPSKIATFAWDGGYQDVAFIGNQVQTPEIFNTNYVYVGVYADGIASTPAKVNCKRSILCIRGNKRSVPGHADFTEFMKAAQEVADCSERLSAAENDIDALKNYEKRPFELTGNPIQMQNFEGMPLNVVTAFEPKQSGSGDPSPSNVRPISGYDALGLTRCGKNLLSLKNHTDVSMNNVSAFVHDNYLDLRVTGMDGGFQQWGGSMDIPDGWCGRTFTFAAVVDANANFGSISPRIFVFAYDGNNTETQLASPDYTGSYVGRASFTIPENTQYLRFLFRVDQNRACPVGSVMYISSVQLEEGAAQTAFEPYQGNIYTAQPGQTVYAGRMDWNTGEMVVDKAIRRFSANQSPNAIETLGNGNNRLVYYRDSNAINSAIPEGLMCDIAAPGPGEIAWSVFMAYGHVYFVVPSGVTSIDREWNVIYRLAEPFTIQLFPTDIAALDGENNIFGDGEITVSGRKDILWLTSDLIERIKTLEKAVATLENTAATT